MTCVTLQTFLLFMCNSCYSYANKVVNIIIYTFETGSFVTKRSTLASPPVDGQETEHTTVMLLLLVLSHVTKRPFWWTKFPKNVSHNLNEYVFLLFTETATNVGYSCHLLTDDMTEVFKIEGESLESVQQAIEECKGKILGPEAAVSRMQSKDNSLKDVEVEVLLYKDNFVGEISQEAEVREILVVE